MTWAGLPLLSLLPLDAFVPKVTAKDSSKKDKKKDEEAVKSKGSKQDDKDAKLKEKQDKESEAKAQKAKDKDSEAKAQKAKDDSIKEKAKEAKLKEKKEKDVEKVAAEEAKEAKLKEKKQKEDEKVSAAKTSKKDKSVEEVHALTRRAQARSAITIDLIVQVENAKTKAGADGAKEAKVKSKKTKDAHASSPRQSPRLAAAGGGAVIPAVDIGKKRKADAAPDVPAATGAGSKSSSRAGDELLCRFVCIEIGFVAVHFVVVL